MEADIVVGGAFGDEGKGKVVAYLSSIDKHEIVARAGVGPNAGHTVINFGKKYALSMLPSAVLAVQGAPRRLLIGPGVLVSPERLLAEINSLGFDEKKVGIDKRCTVIMREHIEADKNSEVSSSLGTTKTGCGPALASRVNRTAKLAHEDERLQELLTDVPSECLSAKKVLVEASQGFGLSVLYGTYPYVTSKDTTAASALVDVGIGPKHVNKIYMVVKAYTTRVGNGPLADEMPFEKAKSLGWDEYGTVTGRTRRISDTLDFDMLRYAAKINSATDIVLTKLDARFAGAANLRDFWDLPSEARRFVAEIENQLNLRVSLIGTGQEVFSMIDRR